MLQGGHRKGQLIRKDTIQRSPSLLPGPARPGPHDVQLSDSGSGPSEAYSLCASASRMQADERLSVHRGLVLQCALPWEAHRWSPPAATRVTP